MAYEQILTEASGRVGVIRLNRPQKLNAWTDIMSREMSEQIREWNKDDGIGAFVITGEGRGFCAGADIGGFSDRLTQTPSRNEEMQFGYSFTHLLRDSKPSVIAFNGYAMGVGLTMALPADVRIASTKAGLSIRFVKMGLMPELGSTRILAELVGLGNATDMCLTGRIVPADEALRMGLVTQVVEPDALMDAAMAKATELANNPTPAVMLIKQLLARNAMEPSLDAVMEREGVRDRLARKWPEHEEAIRAFQEKREPNFFK